MIPKRDEVYGLSPMDRLALETSRPSVMADSRKYRDSMLVSDDLIVDAQPARRKKRSPHCWLFTSLFVFVIIMSTLLLIHFHDEITGHAGVPVRLVERSSAEDETFYMNVESGLMGNRKMSGLEANILNALASRDTVKIEQALKKLSIRPRGNHTNIHDKSVGKMLKDDQNIFDRVIFRIGDGVSAETLEAILKYMPYIVQFLGGPSSSLVLAMLWLVNTVEMKPLMYKYLGREFTDQLIMELEGQAIPGQSTTPAPSSDTTANSPGFLELGSPELIMPIEDYRLISPETAAELQGLLYS